MQGFLGEGEYCHKTTKSRNKTKIPPLREVSSEARRWVFVQTPLPIPHQVRDKLCGRTPLKGRIKKWSLKICVKKINE